ncbi:MAG: FG-GAP repeat protein, partial [Planctomycetes bacterium]|nr:FG-GAP repeat protein [Planctomycetota bacterium]
RKIASGTPNGPSLANGDFFGGSVSSLGDLDGDGVTDLAVGAPGDDASLYYTSMFSFFASGPKVCQQRAISCVR